MSRGSKKAGNVAGGILVLLVLMGVIGFFGIFTKWFKEPVATFYLKYGNELFIGDCETELPHEKVKLEVKYLLGALETNTEYTIKIEANAEAKFDFTLGDKEYSSDFGDLTNFFEIEKERELFTLDLKGLTSLSVYTGKPFILTVISSSGEAVRLKFGVKMVSEIELSATEVVF